jgi:DNA-binding transcriptional ArsR family regulator
MKKFSERKGHVETNVTLQTEDINDNLRNSLWNVLDQHIWSLNSFLNWDRDYEPGVFGFSKDLWSNYFKKPVDSRPPDKRQILATIRKHYFNCNWYEVYDFLEFIVNRRVTNSRLQESINKILERELSGFRLVSGNFIDITDEQEVQALEEVLRDTKFSPVTLHLQRALELLTDRQHPDYRNSIKESISAVESMARIITGKTKATLGAALKELESKGKIHQALKDGFSKLYGYTSDAEGVRHAMLEESNLSAADAKYFLISCTSFVNYLKSQM